MKSKMNEKRNRRIIVRRIEKLDSFPDICGRIFPFSSKKDFYGANLINVVMIRPSIPHYHRATTELYYFLSGSGYLVFRERDVRDISQGMFAIIRPNNAHFVIPSSAVSALVFSVPAWREEDQIICDAKDPHCVEVGYSEYSEKSRLIEAILAKEGLAFRKGMRRADRESLDIERQSFVLQTGLNRTSIPDLRKMLALE